MAKRYYDKAMNRSVAYEEEGDRMFKRSMLKEDHSKPSNLPQEVVMKEYPPMDYFNSYIDDTIYGIDAQHDAGVKGLKKQVRRRMF